MSESSKEASQLLDDRGDDHFIPSEKEQEIISQTLSDFRVSYMERNQSLEYFDGKNLVDYVENSTKRFYSNKNEREDIENWQADIHDPFTHNKVIAFLSKVVKVLPKGEVLSKGTENKRKGEILSRLYDFSEEQDDYEEYMTFALLEAIVKGTVIGYEGYHKNKRQVRDITGYDEDGNMEIQENEIEENRLFAKIVPIEDFYPQSISIRNVKDMDYCFWSEDMPFSKFISDWGHFDKASKVQPYSDNMFGEEKPHYIRNLKGLTEEGNVRVIRKYDEIRDEYIVIANGVWLNPMKGEKISPLPFNHKKLPFYNIKFDFFGSDFFYGKSLPDKLSNMQDVLDALTNMMLDQSFLSIFSPILTAGHADIEEDYLRPGRRIPVDTQGGSLSDSFMKLDLGTPSGWHQYILEYMRSIMEESSVDQVSQGVAGVGGRTTAQEIRQAAEAVEALMGLFGQMINYGLKRKVHFRVSNIQQFWTDKNTPLIKKITNDGIEEIEGAFNEFELSNANLSDGERGTQIISIVDDETELPSKEEQRVKKDLMEEESGRNIEIITLTGDYIRDTKFDVVIGIDQSRDESKEMRKALELEKTRVLMEAFPDILNRRELATDLIDAYDGDPERLLAEQEEEMSLREEMAMQDGSPDDVANNMVRGARGGEEGANNLQALQDSMLG